MRPGATTVPPPRAVGYPCRSGESAHALRSFRQDAFETTKYNGSTPPKLLERERERAVTCLQLPPLMRQNFSSREHRRVEIVQLLMLTHQLRAADMQAGRQAGSTRQTGTA